MTSLRIEAAIVPQTLAGSLITGAIGAPRFWATIWSDVLKASWKPSTRRRHLAAIDRLYKAVQRQRGSDCLDRLLAEADAQALEECLLGFLTQLRNEAVVDEVDRASTWTSAVMFVSDMLSHSGSVSTKVGAWRLYFCGSKHFIASSFRTR